MVREGNRQSNCGRERWRLEGGMNGWREGGGRGRGRDRGRSIGMKKGRKRYRWMTRRLFSRHDEGKLLDFLRQRNYT
jgi:hypothetical protein